MALSVVEECVPEVLSDAGLPSSSEKKADSIISQKEWPTNCFMASLPTLMDSTKTEIEDDEPEVDTRCFKIRQPMHTPVTTSAAATAQGTLESFVLKPRLTLSAFRGPAANMTQADLSRRLEEHYDISRPGMSGVLGHGAFSTVRLAMRRSDSMPVAVKIIAKHEALRSSRLRPGRHLEEWEILRKMKGHPGIIQLLDVFETEEEIQLVLEYCEGGELFNAIQRKRNRCHSMRRGQYSEQQAACITSQILRALVDLHAAGVVHRDVKPENILLASSADDENSIRVKLCDFGMARTLIPTGDGSEGHGDVSPLTPNRYQCNSMIGSCLYVAPEICYGSTYDSAVDIYSLGVTLYILLCGFPPIFSGPEGDQVTFPATYWKDISEDAKELVRKMLRQDASARITAHEALRDQWIWKHRTPISQALSHIAIRRRSLVQNKSNECSNNNTQYIDLDVVRRHLSKTLSSASYSPKRRSATDNLLLSPKRQRVGAPPNASASSALMALADLYRDVAQSPSAKIISSMVHVDTMDNHPRNAAAAASVATTSHPFKRSPLPTLSV